MPKKMHYPKPSKRYLKGAWIIFWRYSPEQGKYKQYTVSTGLTKQREDEAVADNILRRFAVALAEDKPKFPAEFAGTAGVLRYLEDRLGADNAIAHAGRTHDPDSWISAYEPIIKKECKEMWAKNSISFLKRLDKFVAGGIGKTDSALAGEFLQHVLDEGGSRATRNRVLAACKRFYRWCKASGRLDGDSPFAGIKSLKETKLSDIVYCTREERDRIIAQAQALKRPDWLAIPIAFHANCRREEIFLLDWKRDINLTARKIVVRISKTEEPRTIPINKDLFELLIKHRKPRGYVVPRVKSQTWQNQADRLIELLRERLSIPENPQLAALPSEPVGKRKFLMSESEVEGFEKTRIKKIASLGKKLVKVKRDSRKSYDLAVSIVGHERIGQAAHDGKEWIPAERIGWNAFRHTFGSLLAQSGVSLDKISSWMGNSPEVCRRHYAQFVPRDRHDEDIDKL